MIVVLLLMLVRISYCVWEIIPPDRVGKSGKPTIVQDPIQTGTIPVPESPADQVSRLRWILLINHVGRNVDSDPEFYPDVHIPRKERFEIK